MTNPEGCVQITLLLKVIKLWNMLKFLINSACAVRTNESVWCPKMFSQDMHRVIFLDWIHIDTIGWAGSEQFDYSSAQWKLEELQYWFSTFTSVLPRLLFCLFLISFSYLLLFLVFLFSWFLWFFSLICFILLYLVPSFIIHLLSHTCVLLCLLHLLIFKTKEHKQEFQKHHQ